MNIFLDVYLEKNLGDDLFLDSVLMRYKQHTFYIFTQLDYSELEAKHANLKIIQLNKYINFAIAKLGQITLLKKWVIKKYQINAVVCIGGSIFIQFEGWEKLYRERIELWKHMYNKNKKVFIIGSNFGPYSTEEFINRYNEAFDYVEDICFRDDYSYDLFKQRQNVRQEADVIMSYPVESFKTDEEDAVGISVINLTGRNSLHQYQETYISKMVEVVDHFASKGKKVYLLSFCEREGDEDVIRTILEKVKAKPEMIEAVYYSGNIDHFINLFSKVKQIIACRFHSIILGYIFNKEVYSLIYSAKSSHFINDHQLGIPMELIENINQLSPQKIEQAFKKSSIDSEVLLSGGRQYLALDQFLKKV